MSSSNSDENCNGNVAATNQNGGLGGGDRLRLLDLEQMEVGLRSEDNRDQDKLDFTGTSANMDIDIDVDSDGTDGARGIVTTNSDTEQIRADVGPNWERSKEIASKVMNNTLVMAKIAEKLRAEELLTLRETCPVWHQNLTPQLKGKHKKILLNRPQNSVAYDYLRDTYGIIRDLGASPCIPFSRYSYASISSTYEKWCLQELINKFGCEIRSFSLWWHDRKNLQPDELRKIIFDLTPTLSELNLYSTSSVEFRAAAASTPRFVKSIPKLRRLEAHGPFMRHDADSEFTQLISDIVQCASELEWLKLSNGSHNHNFLNPVLTALFDSSVNHAHKLKTLQVPPLKPPDLQILLQLARRNRDPLQLETLYLDTNFNLVLGPHFEPTTRLLPDFLTTQSAKLKTIFLNFNSPYKRVQWFTFCVPPLEHLKCLQISHTGFTPPKIRFRWNTHARDVKFEHAFPELRRLSYKCGYGRNFLDKLFRYLHPQISDLELQSVPNDFAQFSSLRNLFEGLTRLKLSMPSEFGNHKHKSDVHIDVKKWAKIWKTWPNLTAVHLEWEANGLDLDLDVFLTGVPRSGLEHLRRHLNTITHDLTTRKDAAFTLASLRTKLDLYKTRPGISNLKHLQEISIIVNGKRKPQLTDMGGYFGLALASPHLQQAIIHGRGKNLVSEECQAFIKRAFGQASVIDL